MGLKKILAVTLMSGALVSSMGSTGSCTPTMVQAVGVPQYQMNLNNNANYVLVWSHLKDMYYIDLASIVVKQNDKKIRWWAENIVETTKDGTYTGWYTREFCYDRTNGNTRMWNSRTAQWEDLETYDCRTASQLDARAYNLGYIFAFQGGNPIEN